MNSMAAKDWQKAPGRIIKSGVKIYEDSEGQDSYSLHLQYEYWIGQDKYRGSKLSLKPDVHSHSLKEIKLLEKKYSKGDTVQVLYNPNYRKEAILENEYGFNDYVRLFTPLIFVLAGLFIIIRSYHFSEV